MSEFVYKCIESGFPAKYAAYNACHISTSAIKGNKAEGEKGSKEDPIWGQSRVVFFPDNADHVYKVALSVWGMRANNSEKMVSDKFKQHGGENLIGLVNSVTSNKCIETMELIDTKTYVVTQDVINRLKSAIDNFCKENKIPLNMIGDLHSNNIGTKNNHWVAIDYAMTDRRVV